MHEISAVQRTFILHWGEMGTRWGINRTMAQVHALLYLSADPLPAEAIQDALQVARSNVSTSLRELQNWGVVRVVHHLGDRRDHFESLSDVWQLFRIVLEERKRREIDPTIELLDRCIEDARRAGKRERHTLQRLDAMREFFTTMTAWYEEVSRLPQPALRSFLRMGSKVKRLLKAS